MGDFAILYSHSFTRYAITISMAHKCNHYGSIDCIRSQKQFDALSCISSDAGAFIQFDYVVQFLKLLTVTISAK